MIAHSGQQLTVCFTAFAASFLNEVLQSSSVLVCRFIFVMVAPSSVQRGQGKAGGPSPRYIPHSSQMRILIYEKLVEFTRCSALALLEWCFVETGSGRSSITLRLTVYSRTMVEWCWFIFWCVIRLCQICGSTLASRWETFCRNQIDSRVDVVLVCELPATSPRMFPDFARRCCHKIANISYHTWWYGILGSEKHAFHGIPTFQCTFSGHQRNQPFPMPATDHGSFPK